MSDKPTPYFSGMGKEQRHTHEALPEFQVGQLREPENYQASPSLAAAVNVALTLGMPLLLTGESGCGKSELAQRIAWEMGFTPIDSMRDPEQRVLSFTVKSTTEARDLFYRYDAVGRFHAAQLQQVAGASSTERDIEPKTFIHYQALGLAILRAKGSNSTDLQDLLSQAQLDSLPKEPTRSIVLIDEIDKAPRDVPNDILHEIDKFEFEVPELIMQSEHHAHIALNAEKPLRPVVIFTSNDERELPPAFLRRCVFCHVPFPPFTPSHETPDEYSFENIVAQRLGTRYQDLSVLQREALVLCRYLREEVHALKKRPGLAEMLNWFYCLNDEVLLFQSKQVLSLNDFKRIYLQTCYSLFKHQSDIEQAAELFEQWSSQTTLSAEPVASASAASPA